MTEAIGDLGQKTNKLSLLSEFSNHFPAGANVKWSDRVQRTLSGFYAIAKKSPQSRNLQSKEKPHEPKFQDDLCWFSWIC